MMDRRAQHAKEMAMPTEKINPEPEEVFDAWECAVGRYTDFDQESWATRLTSAQSTRATDTIVNRCYDRVEEKYKTLPTILQDREEVNALQRHAEVVAETYTAFASKLEKELRHIANEDVGFAAAQVPPFA